VWIKVCNPHSRTSTELLAPSACSEWLDLVVLRSVVLVPFYWHLTHFKEITDRGTRWSETRGTLETYAHCMEPGLVFEKGIGPNYPGSGKDVSRFSRLNDQAKKSSSSGTLVHWISAPPRLIFWILPPLEPLEVIIVTGHMTSTLGYWRFSAVMTVPFLG